MHRIWVEVPHDGPGTRSPHGKPVVTEGGAGRPTQDSPGLEPESDGVDSTEIRPRGMLALAIERHWSAFWDVFDLSMVDVEWEC